MAKNKWYALIHPGAVKGIVHKKPKRQKQDKRKRAASHEVYAVVFFPKITGIGRATLNWPRVCGTISASPEAAKIKFMDKIKAGEKWETYRDAGHRVRRIKLSDLGDA